jgi:hypothetical protein
MLLTPTHAAALDQGRGFRRIDENEVQAAAHQILQGSRAAIVGNERDVDLGHVLEQLGAHVAAGAHARGAIRQLAGVAARASDQVLH